MVINNINKDTDKSVMEEQLKQIHEKQLKDYTEKMQRREDEVKGYMTLKNDIDRDKKEREIELISKRREFMKAIEDLKAQKNMKDTLDKVNSNDYQYNYFPYTHGDNIEKRREDINAMLKNDLKEYMHNRLVKYEKDTNLSKMSSVARTIMNSRQSDRILGNTHQQRSFSSNFRNEESDNVFMKPHKTHLKRHIPEEQIENNTKRALKHYEQQLLKERANRKIFESNPTSKILNMNEYEIDEKARKQLRIEQTKKALDEQAKEQEYAKLKSFLERKEFTNTNFGPEEGEELRLIYKQKREKEKEILDKELKAQMLAKAEYRANDKLLTDQVDKLVISQNQAMVDAEVKNLKIKKKLQQQKNVKNWNEQTLIKHKFRQTAY